MAKKDYTVYMAIDIKANVNFDVEAESEEDAVEQAQKLFYDADGDVLTIRINNENPNKDKLEIDDWYIEDTDYEVEDYDSLFKKNEHVEALIKEIKSRKQ